MLSTVLGILYALIHLISKSIWRDGTNLSTLQRKELMFGDMKSPPPEHPEIWEAKWERRKDMERKVH